MIININSKGILMTEGMKSAIQKKLEILDKFLPENESVKVKVTQTKGDSTVLVMFAYNNKLITIKETGDDFYVVMDILGDSLKHKMERAHSLKDKQKRDQEKAFKNMDVMEQDEMEDVLNQSLVREKLVKLIPMTIEEAISKMESLGHSSFIFDNLEKKAICMLYKRNDGNYGIIIPE